MAVQCLGGAAPSASSACGGRKELLPLARGTASPWTRDRQDTVATLGARPHRSCDEPLRPLQILAFTLADIRSIRNSEPEACVAKNGTGTREKDALTKSETVPLSLAVLFCLWLFIQE